MSNTDFEFGQVTQADVKAIHAHGYGMVNLGATEDQMRVIFYKRTVINKQRSREAGRPVYDSEIFVKSHMPGEERLQENDRPATDEHKRRWPRQWAAFLQDRAFVPDGTPIDFLFPANPEISAQLRWSGFHTVELLAKATPLAIESLGMGMTDWVNRARRYLEDSSKGVDHHALKNMEAKYERQISVLQKQIADLVSKFSAANVAAGLPGTRVMPDFPPTQPDARPVPQEREWAAPEAGFIQEE